MFEHERLRQDSHARERNPRPPLRQRYLFPKSGLGSERPPREHPCTSTLSFTLQDRHPNEVARLLGEKGIFVWDGNFYAVQLVKALGLHDKGGLVRIGLAPYNTEEEIERTIAEIRNIAAGE